MERNLILISAFALLLSACTQTNAPVTTPVATSVARPSGVRALAIDPRDGKLFKAASDGLFQSGDGGKNWTRMTLPVEVAIKGVATVALRNDQPDTIFVAGEQIGIWRSRDAGTAWEKITRGLASERVSALAVHSNGYPRDRKNSLFAWVDGVGMFESNNEGDSWKRSVDQALGLGNLNVTALTHTPLEGSMNTGWLYASTPAGAYLSMD